MKIFENRVLKNVPS